MTRGMNTMPTARRGRTYYTPGPADKRGVGGILSVLFLLTLLLLPPVVLLGTETARRSRYTALRDAIHTPILELNRASRRDLPTRHASLAHGIAHRISAVAVDPDAGVSLPGALALRRRTEYCQWSEHPSRQCRTCTRSIKAADGSSKTETYDCDCVTHYDYVKTWRDYRINSLLFDQPGAHHNPQRDPLPSRTFPADGAVLTLDREFGGEREALRVRLDPDMLAAGVRYQPFRPVDFVPHGRAPSPSFFRRLLNRFFGERNTRYEPLQLLRDTPHAVAATRENFVYVGQGGYFFSPYDNPSTTQRLFNYFVQYMEGSLFDWQIGDLMPSCTAGDIRFSYQVQDPAIVSVLGEVRTQDSRSSVLEMTPRSTMIGNTRESIGFVHAGSHSARDMIIAEDNASRNMAVIFRVLLLIWSIPAARLLGVALGREVADSSVSTQVMATVGMFGSVLGGIWLVIWGVDVGSRDTILLFVVGGYFGFLAWRSSTRRGRGRWWNAVWCTIGRWASVPPEWRVEDSYVPASVDGVESKRL
ncbi:hypothetical protein ACHAW6_011893 [Cyclotella cf. meneghiniana]